MKHFIAVYDSDDYPIGVFENSKELARFLKTSSKTVDCMICRHTKRKYRGTWLTFYKIPLDKNDIDVSQYPNINIGAILEYLSI